MFCPSCGTAAQPGQKFCTECGAAIGAAAPATTPATTTTPEPATTPATTPAEPAGLVWADDAPTVASPQLLPPPVVPPPAAAPPVAPPPVVPPSVAPPPAAAPAAVTTAAAATGTYAATNSLNVVEQTSPTEYAPTTWAVEESTTQMPAQAVVAGPYDTSQYTTVRRFRVTPLLVVSVLAALVALVTAFVEVASFEVAGDLTLQQAFKLNDFASNLMVGAVIGAVLLIVGATLGAAGYRLGSGLAGGAGLALAGLFAWAIGQVIALFDRTEVELLNGGGSFTLTTTQEVGFWLAVVAAGLGVLAFGLSLAAAGRDGHGSINPAIGVLGAFGTLAVVIGPMIPMDGAGFGDNFSNDFIPPATLLLRLAVLVLIGVGGMVGFLANRRWGLGVALGTISIGVWLWATALSESGDIPLGIAGGNPGATDYTPHVVTTIGVIVMLLAAVAGLVAVAQQRPGV